MGIYLQQHPVLPPALPPAGAEGGEVLRRTLRSVLKVVATKARWLPVHWVQHMEPSEQAHRRSHPMNISQKWVKIATSVMECGDRY
jgi:hypothetical protein